MKFPKEFLEEPKLVVVPIVDVLLAVFLFLAVLAFKEPLISIFVQLPKGTGKEANLNVVSITLDSKGRIYIKGKVYTLEKLKEFLNSKKPLMVNLMADERTPYKYVAELLSKLREWDITNVNLILKKRS